MLDNNLKESVTKIISDVREFQDDALLRYTKEFDGCAPTATLVPFREVEEAIEQVNAAELSALNVAAAQIEAFHETQERPEAVEFQRNGMTITESVQPIRRVGAYVPGGRFVYPSTVLMTVIAARVAGVNEVVVATPPGPDGKLPAITLAAASIAQVSEVWAVGGTQAIAAMAYGTQTLNAVDLIVGPGNQYVNEAKRQVFGDVGIDALAGPSEVAIILDDMEYVDIAIQAAKAQAEHGPDSRSTILICKKSVDPPQRVQLLREVAPFGRIEVIEFDEISGMVESANQIAAEHLEIYSPAADQIAKQISNAGAIFLNTSAVCGDYIAGSNHVLPTAQSARFSNGLRVSTFQRTISVISGQPNNELTAAGAALANAEGLVQHQAVFEMLRSRNR